MGYFIFFMLVFVVVPIIAGLKSQKKETPRPPLTTANQPMREVQTAKQQPPPQQQPVPTYVPPAKPIQSSFPSDYDSQEGKASGEGTASTEGTASVEGTCIEENPNHCSVPHVEETSAQEENPFALSAFNYENALQGFLWSEILQKPKSLRR